MSYIYGKRKTKEVTDNRKNPSGITSDGYFLQQLTTVQCSSQQLQSLLNRKKCLETSKFKGLKSKSNKSSLFLETKNKKLSPEQF